MTTASVIDPPPQARTGPFPAQPMANKVWTVDQFHCLGDLGLFEGRGAKLIDGQIIEEGPMNHPYAVVVELAMISLQVAFGPCWRMRPQLPLVLSQTTDPLPDLTVVAGDPRKATAHPTTAALVVEVCDATFRYDTT